MAARKVDFFTTAPKARFKNITRHSFPACTISSKRKTSRSKKSGRAMNPVGHWISTPRNWPIRASMSSSPPAAHRPLWGTSWTAKSLQTCPLRCLTASSSSSISKLPTRRASDSRFAAFPRRLCAQPPANATRDRIGLRRGNLQFEVSRMPIGRKRSSLVRARPVRSRP